MVLPDLRAARQVLSMCAYSELAQVRCYIVAYHYSELNPMDSHATCGNVKVLL